MTCLICTTLLGPAALAQLGRTASHILPKTVPHSLVVCRCGGRQRRQGREGRDGMGVLHLGWYWSSIDPRVAVENFLEAIALALNISFLNWQ
jgi:hypothetical protein